MPETKVENQEFRLDIRQLRFFTAIVDYGTMTAAGKALHISQPPLSAQIKLLEEELGCTLFDRTTRKMELTEAGRLLYQRAVAILDQCSSAQNEMADFLSGGTGTLRIGVISSIANTLCLEWIKKFTKTHPGLRFELREGNTFAMLEAVRAGEVELAFVRKPFPQGELECRVLRRDTFCAAGVKKYLPKNGKFPVKKLEGCPLIIYRRWEDAIRNAFREAGIRPQIFCVADDARTVTGMAEEGFGVALVPGTVIPDKIRQGEKKLRVLELKDPGITSELCVVTRKDIYHSSAAIQFLQSMI
jgi:DNA-binding transcriptional LysR family regulator